MHILGCNILHHCGYPGMPVILLLFNHAAIYSFISFLFTLNRFSPDKVPEAEIGYTYMIPLQPTESKKRGCVDQMGPFNSHI